MVLRLSGYPCRLVTEFVVNDTIFLLASHQSTFKRLIRELSVANFSELTNQGTNMNCCTGMCPRRQRGSKNEVDQEVSLAPAVTDLLLIQLKCVMNTPDYAIHCSTGVEPTVHRKYGGASNTVK